MQDLICATRPSSWLCVSVAALPVVLPSVGVPPWPVVAPRESSELIRSATWSAGLAFGLAGVLVCFVGVLVAGVEFVGFGFSVGLGVSTGLGATAATLVGVSALVGDFCSCAGRMAGIGATGAAGASVGVSVATCWSGWVSSGVGAGSGAGAGSGGGGVGSGVGVGSCLGWSAGVGSGAVFTTGAGVDLLVSSGVTWSSVVLPVFCASSAGLSDSATAGVSVSTILLSSEPARIFVMSVIGTRSTAIDSTTSGSSGLAEPRPTSAMISSAA